MDLISLHALMSQGGYHYFEGQTNKTDNLYYHFSTGHNCRGDWFEFRLGREDNDIRFNDSQGFHPIKVVRKNISDSEMIRLIEERIKKK